MSTRTTLLGAAALAGAFVVGRMLAPEPSAPPPPPPIVQHAPAQAGVSSAEIRSAIRAELQRDPIVIVKGEPAPEEPSDEVLAQRANALAQARGVVSAAIGNGRWTSTDARVLVALLPQLGPEQYDEIMSSLIRPVNAQQVKVETNGARLDPT